MYNLPIDVHRQSVARWIDEAWSAVPAEVIIKGFKETGCAVSLDGSEEHLVHIQ